MKYLRYLRYLSYFLIGSFSLCAFSLLSKIVLLKDTELATNYLGYFTPFFAGGVAGLIIGIYFFRIRDMNVKLNQRVKSLEKLITMCSVCNDICLNPEMSEEERKWIDVNTYIGHKKISHGYCPDCYQKELEKNKLV